MQCNSKKMPLDAKFTIILWLPLKMRTLTDEMQRGHFKFQVMKTALRFQMIYNHPNKRPKFPSRDHLSCPITADITSLFPAEVPHLRPPPPTTPPPPLPPSSRTATGWHLLKLCTRCYLTQRDGKTIFCAVGAFISFSLKLPTLPFFFSSPSSICCLVLQPPPLCCLFFAN